jgi:hypothetical protein
MFDVNGEETQLAIKNLIEMIGKPSDTFEAELVTQMVASSLKLLTEDYDTGQVKLMNRALKEMRHAYRVFRKFKNTRCISIFGSARTPEKHADYLAAQEFSAKIAEAGWMCITGAANGIMKAGLEGAKKDLSFGLSIRLPFEVPTNSVIEGDPKLMVFRYFFTRKLMFLTHSDAAAVFPGGFGTMDELYELLTLMQTGKSSIIPVVLMEGQKGSYWNEWLTYVKEHLLANGWISPEDLNFFYVAESVEKGVEHIQNFYKRYHSSRYVADQLVIRMTSDITDEALDSINQDFGRLVANGKIEKSLVLPQESNYQELPRLVFKHTQKDFGLLRALIDRINQS